MEGWVDRFEYASSRAAPSAPFPWFCHVLSHWNGAAPLGRAEEQLACSVACIPLTQPEGLGSEAGGKRMAQRDLRGDQSVCEVFGQDL